MSNEEKVSGQFGISWSLEKDYALNYVFYKKNDVQSNFGWIAEMEIDKADIFAIWGVVGERKEIVINPRHCQGVNFEKVIRA